MSIIALPLIICVGYGYQGDDYSMFAGAGLAEHIFSAARRKEEALI